MFYFQNKVGGQLPIVIEWGETVKPFSSQNSYKVGQNWPPKVSHFSTVVIDQKQQQPEKCLCLRNGWILDYNNENLWYLAWGSSHAFSPALWVRRFCLVSAGCKDQQLFCRGEKGLIQFRVVSSGPANGLVSWSDSFGDEQVGRDSDLISPRLQSWLGQDRKALWRKSGQKCVWEVYPRSSTDLK